MWDFHEISFTDLITTLINMAFKRGEEAGKVERTFQSKLDT